MCAGKSYIDEYSARKFTLGIYKLLFEAGSNPFVTSVEYVQNNEGCLSYNHLIAHLDYCMDILTIPTKSVHNIVQSIILLGNRYEVIINAEMVDKTII